MRRVPCFHIMKMLWNKISSIRTSCHERYHCTDGSEVVLFPLGHPFVVSGATTKKGCSENRK
jgi:hypothetical protein